MNAPHASRQRRRPAGLLKIAAFVNCIARTVFMVDDLQTRAALTTAITEAWGMPYALSRPALNLIMLE